MKLEGKSEKFHFHPVEDPKLLIPILQERHPLSCFIYNQTIFYEKFKDVITFYTLTPEIDSKTWIVSHYVRNDYGNTFNISSPNSISNGDEPIPQSIKELFSSPALIDWDDKMTFVALDKPVSGMIYDISVNTHGNVSRTHPCYLFYMDNASALKLPIEEVPDGKIHRLDPELGTDFINSTWNYRRDGSRDVIHKCIQRNASGGVFIDGKYASGAIIMGDGQLHCLYTLHEYRNRGFGKITMCYAFREFARDGCIPCSTVEIKNPRSITFHDSLGMKRFKDMVDYIDVLKINID